MSERLPTGRVRRSGKRTFRLPLCPVSRRIEIELTSKRDESEWTWRAAGAKQPKGTLDASVLYEGAKVGDVVRAEADFEIDGITILTVAAPQGKRAEPENRIAVVGPSRKFEPVTSTLAPKGKGGGKGRGERRGRPDGERSSKGPRDRNEARGKRPERADRPRAQRERPAPPTFKKLSPRDEHRKKVLEQVPAEQRPIAEKVLRGGIPSVRQAIDEENAKAKAEGRSEINSAALLALAEELLPQLKAAEWLDRAQAAKESVNEISVRDLRAVVASADAGARGDAGRLLAAELREALERRSNEARDTWIKEMGTALDENRVLRALNLSSRPPDPQVKFPPELLDRLKSSAEAALTPETRPDHWIKLLDSLSKSPVRRSVETVGLPAEPGEALLEAAKEAVGRVPALSKVLGMKVPPPPRRRVPPPPPAPSKTEPASQAPAGSEAAVHDDQPGGEA